MCLLIRPHFEWIGLVACSSGPCECGRPGTAECAACRRSWVWSDGSIFDFDEFHDWFSIEPQSDEGCAYFYRSGWRGNECKVRYRFICKTGKMKITLRQFSICISSFFIMV